MVKALGIGISQGICFKDIEIYNNKLGKPKLRFFKKTKKIINLLKIKKIHISISDTKNYAQSIVILEN